MKAESYIEPNFFVVASVFMLVFTVGLFILHFFKFPVDATILETHVRLLNLESTQVQTKLYLTLLSLFAIICAITLLFPSVRMIPRATHLDPLIMIMVMVMAIVLGSWSRAFYLGFLVVAGALIVLRARWPIIEQDPWWPWLLLHYFCVITTWYTFTNP